MSRRIAGSLLLITGLTGVFNLPASVAEQPIKRAPATASAVLSQAVEFDFEQVPVSVALDWLRDNKGLKVVLDRAELDEQSISADALLNVKLRHLPLRAALRLALEPLGLGYVLRDEVLLVTTRAKAESGVYPVVYPVADLLLKGTVKGNPEAYDYDALTHLIETVIAASSWEDMGGAGSLAAFDTSLVISQSGERHDEIARLLSDLRRARRARPSAKPGPLAPSGPWEKSFSVKFDKVSLSEAMAKLSDSAGVDILLDRTEIGEHQLVQPVSTDKPLDDENLVSLQLDKTKLREALREVLFPHDLAHIERHGAVVVTSLEQADESCRLQVYDVKVLLRDRDGKAETVADLDYDAVVMLLMSAVAPSSWDDAGGPGTLSAYDGLLVVSQTDSAHQQIASLLEQLRQVKFPTQPGGQPPPDSELRQALNANTTCNFVAAPLDEVLDFFAEKHGLEISLDRPALQRIGVSPEAKIDLRLGEVKLRTALALILAPLDLDYYLQNGALIVSTPKIAEKHPSPRVYDLTDFAAVAKKPKTAALEVSMLLMKTVAPTTWVEADGSGTVVVFENTLVVSNSHAVHCRIEDLLAELRRLRTKPTAAK